MQVLSIPDLYKAFVPTALTEMANLDEYYVLP